jgi:hypothetical protein
MVLALSARLFFYFSKIERRLAVAHGAFHSATPAVADSTANFRARFMLCLVDAFAAAPAKKKKAKPVSGNTGFAIGAREKDGRSNLS